MFELAHCLAENEAIAMAIQYGLGAGDQCVGHGINADLFFHRKIQFPRQRGNDGMFGGAGAFALGKEDKQIIAVGIITVWHLMHQVARIAESLDALD